MKYIENVIIGTPVVDPSQLFSINEKDWNENENDKTLFTDERNLAKIIVKLGIFPSISEIRRNKPELLQTLDKVDFFKLKVTKKRFLWICVGE